MNEQHLYLKGNNFITDWGKYRKKHSFCDTFVLMSALRQAQGPRRLPYGVRLLVLAAEWSPQAFWVGDGRPTAAGVAYFHHKALRR